MIEYIVPAYVFRLRDELYELGRRIGMKRDSVVADGSHVQYLTIYRINFKVDECDICHTCCFIL